jgi:hypothetical protein
LPALVQQNPEQMQRLGMVRLIVQKVSIDQLGLVELRFLVQLHRIGKSSQHLQSRPEKRRLCRNVMLRITRRSQEPLDTI